MGNNNERRKTTKSPTISNYRKQWLRTDGMELIHYEIPDGEADGGEGSLEGWGTSSILWMSEIRSGSSYRSKMSMDVSEMTKEELEAVRNFFNLVFDEAQEVCEHRDRLAREAMEDGNDTHYRLYRQVPKLTQRKGKVREHGEGQDS